MITGLGPEDRPSGSNLGVGASKVALGLKGVLLGVILAGCAGEDSTFLTRSSKVLSLSLATEEDLRIDPGWCSGVTSVTFTGVLEGELPCPGVQPAGVEP